MNINKKKLIVIVGPTASGKTTLSIDLAKNIKCSIISSDSRQFYREMNIGTAKPSLLELKSVPHFFINNLSILDTYSAGKYAKDVDVFLKDYYKKQDTLIMVGGSGLFIDSALKGLDTFPSIPNEIREKLNLDLKLKGLNHLTNLLKEVDLNYYNNVDLKNPRRVIRGLEVYCASKKPYSSFLKRKTHFREDIEIKFIGLNPPREIIYSQIDKRVDLMIKNGLLNEVKGLYKHKDLNPLKTVGYSELFSYLENKISFEESINLIKINTKKYYKRQMTWFRKNKEIKWYTDYKNFNEIIKDY